MFKNLLELYYLLICLIAMIIILVTALLMVNSCTDLMFPEYKYAVELSKYDNNTAYIRSSPETERNVKGLTTEEVDKNRFMDKDNFFNQITSQAKASLIDKFGYMMVALLFFLLHWCGYKKQKVTHTIIT